MAYYNRAELPGESERLRNLTAINICSCKTIRVVPKGVGKLGKADMKRKGRLKELVGTYVLG